MDPDDRPPPPVDLQMASTVTLLEAARAGNAAAREGLFARYVQPLARWASRRLPPGHRSVADTRDLVQDVLLGALRRLDTFDCRGEGALLAYLRRAVINRVRDLARVEQRRPPPDVLASDIVGSEASPLDLAIGSEAIARSSMQRRHRIRHDGDHSTCGEPPSRSHRGAGREVRLSGWQLAPRRS